MGRIRRTLSVRTIETRFLRRSDSRLLGCGERALLRLRCSYFLLQSKGDAILGRRNQTLPAAPLTAVSKGLKVFIAVALLPILSSCHKSAPVPDALQIATAKAVDKFRSVLTTSDPNAPEANAFFDALGVGDPNALLAFPVLRPHLDAGFAELADISLSIALAKNPLGVLALLDSPAKLKDTCVSKFIEPEPGVEQAWYRDAELALRKIDAKSPLAARRDACLEIMRSDEQDALRSSTTAKAIAKFWGATKATNQNNAAAEGFFDAVEAGQSDALLAYPVIYQHLSGGAEDAKISLSLALAKNPSGVLALLDSAAEVKAICVSNLIEPEPGVERAWYRNAETALSKIDSRSPLAARRDACLEIMRSDEQNAGASAPVKTKLRHEPSSAPRG